MCCYLGQSGNAVRPGPNLERPGAVVFVANGGQVLDQRESMALTSCLKQEAASGALIAQVPLLSGVSGPLIP